MAPRLPSQGDQVQLCYTCGATALPQLRTSRLKLVVQAIVNGEGRAAIKLRQIDAEVNQI